jgi:hypothetical protein
MCQNERKPCLSEDVAKLVEELERAEAYEQRLRQFIVDAKDELAKGNASKALSMLNQAINYIDSATDVVTGKGAG